MDTAKEACTKCRGAMRVRLMNGSWTVPCEMCNGHGTREAQLKIIEDDWRYTREREAARKPWSGRL